MTKGEKPELETRFPAVAGGGAAGTWDPSRPRKPFAFGERQAETADREKKIAELVMMVIKIFEESQNKYGLWLQVSVKRLQSEYENRPPKELEDAIFELPDDLEELRKMIGQPKEGDTSRDKWFAIALALREKKSHSQEST